jgi:hypothetical protein
MPRVVAAMGANDDVCVTRKVVDDLTLTLISPLSTDHCYDGHP